MILYIWITFIAFSSSIIFSLKPTSISLFCPINSFDQGLNKESSNCRGVAKFYHKVPLYLYFTKSWVIHFCWKHILWRGWSSIIFYVQIGLKTEEKCFLFKMKHFKNNERFCLQLTLWFCFMYNKWEIMNNGDNIFNTKWRNKMKLR